jgi:hypothetical protein
MKNSPVSSSLLLESLVNHISLPPRLPGKQESEDWTDQIESALTERVLNASRTFSKLAQDERSMYQWECTRIVLQTCKAVKAGCRLNKTALLTEFRRFNHNGFLILHVAEQNAGLLIRRQHE